MISSRQYLFTEDYIDSVKSILTLHQISIDIAAMDDGGETTSREFRDRAILSDFISEYRQLPELWDIRCKVLQ